MSKLAGDPGYRAGWCIHYRSPNEAETCEAGIRFDSLRVTPFASRPCFLTQEGQSKPDAALCDKLRRPTAEEIAAHNEWAATRKEKLVSALVAIQPWRTEMQRDRRADSKVFDCPACGGKQTLGCSIARNGHVHGRCSTDHCVAWME